MKTAEHFAHTDAPQHRDRSRSKRRLNVMTLSAFIALVTACQPHQNADPQSDRPVAATDAPHPRTPPPGGVLPFPAPDADELQADARDEDTTTDAGIDEVSSAPSDASDIFDRPAQRDAFATDGDAASVDVEFALCPPAVQSAVVECIFTEATEGAHLGDWDRALTACTTPTAIGTLLDAACVPGATEPLCEHPRDARPEQWLSYCRHFVEDAVRDDLCLFDDTWSSTLLSGRVIPLDRKIWTEPTQVPSSYLELLDQILGAGPGSGMDWPEQWASRSIDRVELEQLIDLTRLANLWVLAVTTPTGRRAAVYAETGVDAVALLEDDHVSGCTLGEGDGLRPCRGDFECRPDHVCRIGTDQELGRCIDRQQTSPAPSDGQPCAGHQSCAPPGAICMVGAADPICIPATSRVVSSRWGGAPGTDAVGTPVLFSEIDVYGARARTQAAAIRLHMRAPLALTDRVTLLGPDGSEFPIPWTGDWSEWVPLPHVAGVAANGVWRLTIRRASGGIANGFDGWSLRVDAL